MTDQLELNRAAVERLIRETKIPRTIRIPQPVRTRDFVYRLFYGDPAQANQRPTGILGDRPELHNTRRLA